MLNEIIRVSRVKTFPCGLSNGHLMFSRRMPKPRPSLEAPTSKSVKPVRLRSSSSSWKRKQTFSRIGSG